MPRLRLWIPAFAGMTITNKRASPLLARLRRSPGSVDRLNAWDNARMARTPAEAVACFLRGHKLILVEPGADIVSLCRAFAADLAGVAPRRNAGAHDIEAARPQLVAEMEDLAGDDGVVGLGRQPIGFSEVGDMDPRPAAFLIAPEHDLARLCHREPISADTVVAVMAVHEAGTQHDRGDVGDRQRFLLERAAERERMRRIGLDLLVHDEDRQLAEDRAAGGVDEAPPRVARRQI